MDLNVFIPCEFLHRIFLNFMYRMYYVCILSYEVLLESSQTRSKKKCY
jgi:hypothetical protein